MVCRITERLELHIPFCDSLTDNIPDPLCARMLQFVDIYVQSEEAEIGQENY